MRWGRYEFEKEDELKESFKTFIHELLEEASPFIPLETLKELSKKKAEELYDNILDDLEDAQKTKEELEKERDELLKEKEEWEKERNGHQETLDEKETEIEELETKIENLELRINNPAEFFGRKFGI